MLKAGSAARRRSLRWNTPVDPATLRAGVEGFLRALDEHLQERDPAWVGHCKLLVSAEAGAAYASLVAAGDPVRWSGELAATSSAEITIYAAIYGQTDADVARTLDDALDRTDPTNDER